MKLDNTIIALTVLATWPATKITNVFFSHADVAESQLLNLTT